jgi:hypothetical protein
MPTLIMKLDLDTLAVETFAPAVLEAPPAAIAATVASCSAFDACLTRLCSSRC